MTAFDRYRYAERLFRERRYSAASRELEHLITDERAHAADQGTVPHLGDAPMLLARSYYHSAQLTKAEQAARDLIADDPTEGYAVLLLARTLQRQGRGEEARSWLRRLDALGYGEWSDQFAADSAADSGPDSDSGPEAAAVSEAAFEADSESDSAREI